MPLRVRGLRAGSGIAAALVSVVLVAGAVATSVSQPKATTAEDASAQPGVPTRPTPQLAQPNAPSPFLDSFNVDLAGTYSQSSNGTESSLTIDATTTGDLQLKLHLELVTTGGGGQAPSTVTANKAQLLDLASNAVVCDGKLTAFNRQLIQATCDGAGPYQGVRMTLEPILNADSGTTLTGSLSGTMQRMQ